jgi:rubrerythrin
MASICPKCRREIAEDAVCCAEVYHTWKCRSCGKRSTGYVVPYGKCFLCGGDNETVESFTPTGDKATLRLVQEAIQMELDTYQFYRLGGQKAVDETQRAVFEQLAMKEKDHLDEIREKYHVPLDPEAVELPPDAESLLSSWIFQGIDFEAPEAGVEEMYRRALIIEGCTRDHFFLKAEKLPPGPEQELCREFAAEEEDHIALLESELEHYQAAQARA